VIGKYVRSAKLFYSKLGTQITGVQVCS